MTTPSRPPAAYDLHLHTYWSYDATADPEAHFRRASELGLRCIAITEHHNLDSAEPVRRIAERYPDVQLIVAAELTVTTSIGDVDLLCYNLPREPVGALANVMAQYRQWQQDRGAAVSRGMQKLGYDYTDEHRLEVLRTYRPQEVIDVQGITHVRNGVQARYFVERGFIHDASEQSELMRRVNEVEPLPPYPHVDNVVPVVKDAGGVVAIAHPIGYFQRDNRERMDTLCRECDLDGIECAHRRVPPELTAFYREYCLEHGLLSVGGSDSHDNADVARPVPDGHTSEKSFAGHVGPDEWLDELLERIASRV